ncbi:peptide/nickel transport system substrate-binding protein [Actinocorallia herbida]|uniref:Peptide/nickel transport system substrate-binding protein n=1 Tax=Actinocorallia herbida TaxID=58109 RepID=A0A3N1D613_9ACTN|nr:ABC transporter substrate-binding protein [Actinocorallia herbida]ROO88975.1 peptide/nickel transport system substrate-binding protein [Actinocorallia herbida]
MGGFERVSRRSFLRAVAIAGGVATVPGFLTACGAPDAPETAGGGGTLDELRVALPSSLSSLDASKEAGIMNYVVALLCQEALVGVGPDGDLVPALAESWESDDAKTFVYRLRKDVKFSDGTPVTAADIVASLEYNTEKGSTSAFAYAYAGVKSVKATGEHEITIKLDQIDSSFAWTVSPGTLLVTSAKFLANGDKIGTPDVKILGTGPYKVTEFAPDSHVTLERNDAWWGGKAEIAKIRFEFIAEDSTRLLAMRQGEVDIALNVPLEQLAQWQGLDGVEVKTTTDRSLVALAFNTAVKPFDDLRVRKAIGHAVDRKGIVDGILGGHAEVATTLPSSAQWAGLPAADVAAMYAAIPQVDFDLAKAKEELAASSVPGGFKATLTYPNSGSQLGKAALTLAENLKGLGIELTVKEITLEAWIAELTERKSGLLYGWYFATTGDPAEFTQQLLNGANAAAGGTNIASYANAKVTSLLDQAKATTEDKARTDLIGRALTLAAADLPYQPLWWGQSATAFGPKVTADGYGPYFFISPWAAEVAAK